MKKTLLFCLMALLAAIAPPIASADIATISWDTPTTWVDDTSDAPHKVAPGELKWINLYCGAINQGFDRFASIMLTPDPLTGKLPTSYQLTVTEPTHCAVSYVAEPKETPGIQTESGVSVDAAVGPWPVVNVVNTKVIVTYVKAAKCTQTTFCTLPLAPPTQQRILTPTTNGAPTATVAPSG